ncbi:MAG: hypothetical protein ACJA2S_003696 [Cyclobacteriaceae bacterium]|jgi:hypothetical protein
MNKTAKIIIGILVLVCGFLVVYSNIKAMEADNNYIYQISLVQ